MSQPIGSITILHGTATATLDGETRTLKVGASVFQDDQIITKADSALEILFADETVMAQGADSELILDVYTFDPASQEGKLSFDLVQGSFRSVTGVIVDNNPENFELDSPLATIGIRGTTTAHIIPPEWATDAVEDHVVLVYDGKPVMIVPDETGEIRLIDTSGRKVEVSELATSDVTVMTVAEYIYYEQLAHEQLLQQTPQWRTPEEVIDRLPDTDRPVGPNPADTNAGDLDTDGDGDVDEDDLEVTEEDIYETVDSLILSGDASEDLLEEGTLVFGDQSLLITGTETGLLVLNNTLNAANSSSNTLITTSSTSTSSSSDPSNIYVSSSGTYTLSDSQLSSGFNVTPPSNNAAGTFTFALPSGKTSLPSGSISADFSSFGSNQKVEFFANSITSGGYFNITTGAGSDAVRGTNHNPSGDSIDGGAGDDDLSGYEGDDTIEGGTGNDTIYGDHANAAAPADSDNDSLLGGTGNDSIYGNEGNDTLKGGDGNDLLYGNQDNAGTVTTSDNDFIDGEDGDDSLHGGEGQDTLEGGAGNDTLLGDDGNDNLKGEAGNDKIDGGAGNDTLTGGADSDTLEGGTGNDSLDGGTGNDSLRGDDGDDTITGGTGRDTMEGGDGNDVFVYSGTSEVHSSETISGDGGTNSVRLTGDTDFSSISSLSTNFSNVPTLQLMAGISGTFSGSQGAQNVFTALSGSSSSGTTESVLVNMGTATTLSLSTITSMTDWATEDYIQVTGDSASENITGSMGYDRIYGNDGDDTLSGGTGNDSISGGDDADTFNFTNSGEFTNDDTLIGGSDSSVDTLNANLASGTDYTFANVSQMEEVVLTTTAASVSVNLAGSLGATEGTVTWDCSGVTSTSQTHLDLSAETDGVRYLAGAHSNDVTTGSGDDTFDFSATDFDTNDNVVGGSGDDTLKVDSSDTSNLTAGRFISVETIAITGSTSLDWAPGSSVFTNDTTIDLTSMTQTSTNELDASLVEEKLKVKLQASQDHDVQTGTGDDTVIGLGGDDTITGNAGDDSLDGGAGADSIHGSAGDDILLGGAGNDTLKGDDDADTITGGAGADSSYGGDGNDVFVFTATSDVDGSDYLYGNAGTNTVRIDGDTGFSSIADLTYNFFDVTNLLLASGKTATFDAGQNAFNVFTTVTGSSSSNTTEAITVNMGTSTSVDLSGITTSNWNSEDYIKIVGDDDAETLKGSAGYDSIEGNGGGDQIFAYAGDDNLSGGNGSDSFKFTSAGEYDDDDTIDGGTDSGADTLVINLSSTVGSKQLTNVSNIEKVEVTSTTSCSIYLAGSLGAAEGQVTWESSGVSSSYTFYLNTTADSDGMLLTAGASKHQITTGSGDDIFDFSGTTFGVDDTLSGGDGTDTVKLDGGDVGNLNQTRLTSLETFAITGTSTLNWTVSSALFSSATTIDLTTMSVSSGTNVLNASSVSADLTVNTLNEATVAHTISLGSGDNTVSGGNGAETITAGTGKDNLSGGDGDDTFTFGQNYTNDDTVNGGDGTGDTMTWTSQSNSAYSLENVSNVETITLGDPSDTFTNITLCSSLVGSSSAVVTVDGSAITSTFTFDALKNGAGLTITGASGTGSTTFKAGSTAVTSGGTVGADKFTTSAGTGSNTMIFSNTSVSDNSLFNCTASSGTDTLQIQGNVDISAPSMSAFVTGLSVLQLDESATLTMNKTDVSEFAAGFTTKGNASSGTTETLLFKNTSGGTFDATGINPTFSNWNANEDVITYEGSSASDTIKVGTNINTLGYGEKVVGNGGDDTFEFNTGFSNNDTVVGEAGSNDTLKFTADTTTDYTFANVTAIETIEITLASGTCEVTLAGTLGSADPIPTFDASNVGDGIDFDGSNETTGLNFIASGGGDTVKGSSGDDEFDFSSATFGSFDSVDGQGGSDSLKLVSATGANLNANTSNLETYEFTSSGALDWTLTDAVVASGATVTFNLASGNSTDALNFDASAESDGSIILYGSNDATAASTLIGGQNADTITGGAWAEIITGGGGNDQIFGNGGDDTLTGGAGNDTFGFDNLTDAKDRIQDFATDSDKLHFKGTDFYDADWSFEAGDFSGSYDGSSGLTTTTTDALFVYDTHSGDVWYDDNGATAGGNTRMCILEGTSTAVDGDDITVSFA